MKKLNGKYLSMILRHRPEEASISLDEFGWADVDALLKGLKRDADINDLIEIVNTDNKNRFSFSEDMKKIRANQGHSINVSVQMSRLTPPDELFHGTAEKSVDSIMREGIRKMGRLYVHLSKDIDTAFNVGKRHGRPVIFRIDTGKMHEDGFVFYLSDNGVWLTDNVPVRYLERISKEK